VILDKTVRRLGTAPTHRQTDLVATVSLLTDLLEQASAAPHGPDIETIRNVAELALTAAVKADRHLEQQNQQISELERQAMTDPLTGLLNRRGFERSFKKALAAARRYGETGVLMSIDLDGFKLINDTYGHNAGDKVLKQVAKILTDNVRETDCVGRIGGDEFVVLLTRTSVENGTKRVRELERHLNGTLVNIGGRVILVRASCGSRGYGAEDRTHKVLSRADAEMYRSKRNQPKDGRTAA
jgi:diguanylate cyclase (GGDEF)-like protein